MRLATIRTRGGTAAVRLDGDVVTETGQPDVGELIRIADWPMIAQRAEGRQYPCADLDFAPVITAPRKIICLGLNYADHIREMGREMPEYPTLFAKYPEALVGANDAIILPKLSSAMDWEAELAVIIGRRVRQADAASAQAAIAGFTVLNDVTARDWQYRTTQWLQGKTFQATTPIGPWLVTADEADGNHLLECLVDGEIVQSASTSQLVFGPDRAVSYVSEILTLEPGDILALGTPGGVGHARTPRRYLRDGQLLTTTIDGIGECRNPCVAEK